MLRTAGLGHPDPDAKHPTDQAVWEVMAVFGAGALDWPMDVIDRAHAYISGVGEGRKQAAKP